MSRFFTNLASVLLSAVVLVASQVLPTPYLNRDRKAEHVADSIADATESVHNWNARASFAEWRRACEAKYGKMTVTPGQLPKGWGGRVRIPPLSSRPRRSPPERTYPTMFDIM